MGFRVSSLIVLALCLAFAAPALGQLIGPQERVEAEPGGRAVQPAPSQDGEPTEKAAAIVQYDDGTADWLPSPTETTVETAMRFSNLGGAGVTLGGIDFCWRQTGGDTKIRYEVVIWATGGPRGAPGAELAKFAAVATGVTSTPTFYHTSFSYPLTTSSDYYVGVRYNPAVDHGFSFCVDDDGLGGTTLPHPGYYRFYENAGWSQLSTFGTGISYAALMVRAYVFTPGVFTEVLGLPYFQVDTTSPVGATTLFAARNLTDGPVAGQIEYFTTGGASQRTDPLSLGPYETETVNIRDIPGLVTGMDGFARGYVTITTPGNPDMTPVLAGDFFQVDVANNFATGDKLFRMISLCQHASVRSLRFPLAGSGTQLKVWIQDPRGTGGGDPPSFTVQAYDENGDAVGGPTPVKTGFHALSFDASTFTGLAFSTLRFDFSNSAGGTVYAEASTEDRFSVGVGAQCDELP